MAQSRMTDKVYHLHKMETGLWELWLPSPATLDTLYLDPTQEHVNYQEIGILKTQHAVKVLLIYKP